MSSSHKPFITILDDRRDYGEDRFLTLGMLHGIVVVVAHTETEEVIRLISARRGIRDEEDLYFKEVGDELDEA
jgi:hypothetical protein